MLSGEHLSFRYSERSAWIVQDFTLTIAPGEVIGLMGPSGFGKTTIAKLLSGYLKPTQGIVRVDNRALPQRGYAPVQLIFQNPELAVNPRWKIRKILAEAQVPAVDLQQTLGIHATWLDRYPHELSGGELQRIAVARVLNQATRYLIADEMTAMLDANTQAVIWKAVLNYAQTYNVGLLIISHELPLLKRLCGQIVELPKIQTNKQQNLGNF